MPLAGEYALSITLRGAHARGSPLRISTQSCGVHAARCIAEGSGVREIVDRLGELRSIAEAVHSRGGGSLGAISPEQRAMVLHALCEQVLNCDQPHPNPSPDP